MLATRKLDSSNTVNQKALSGVCVVNDALTRVGARWKMSALYAIAGGAATFAALKRGLPGVSDHVLATRLRELTVEGLIDKRFAGERHPAYRVTARGEELLAIVHALCLWERKQHDDPP